MLPHFVSFIAGLFFLGSCLLLERLTRGFLPNPLVNDRPRPLRGDTLSGASALACMAFIPPGSLPPLCNSAWGAVFWGMLFTFSSLVAPERPQASAPARGFRSAHTVPAALAALTLALLSYYAWRCGLPGSPLNLGLFVAMPLWGRLDILGKAGFFLVFLGLFLACPAGDTLSSQGLFPAKPLRRLAYFSLLAVIFYPRPLALLSDLSGWEALAADYVCFWVSVLALIRGGAFLDGIVKKKRYPIMMWGLGAVLLLTSLHNSVGILPPGAVF